MAKLTHPGTGAHIDVADSAIPQYRRSGWMTPDEHSEHQAVMARADGGGPDIGGEGGGPDDQGTDLPPAAAAARNRTGQDEPAVPAPRDQES
jgi:hypothetical protein